MCDASHVFSASAPATTVIVGVGLVVVPVTVVGTLAVIETHVLAGVAETVVVSLPVAPAKLETEKMLVVPPPAVEMTNVAVGELVPTLRVQVESEPDVGTRVRLLLPRFDSPAIAAPAHRQVA